MKYQNLIKKISKYYREVGLEEKPNAPIVHKGFPGNFNLSLTEYEFINENSDFIILEKNFKYAKTQQCIRHNDYKLINDLSSRSKHHLLRFTMASVAGVFWVKNANHRKRYYQIAINNLLSFLVNKCKLDPKNIYVKYLEGGLVSKLSEGKYKSSISIAKDSYCQYIKKFNIPKNNFISSENRDALLALNIYGRPTPWGYRNEIFYKHNGVLIDIATVENLTLRPTINSGKLENLEPYNHTLVIGAIGVERLLMILNKLDDIADISIIAKPARALRPYLSPEDATTVIQITRAIQLIIADANSYSKLDKKQKKKIKEYFSVIKKMIYDNNIPQESWVNAMKQIAKQEQHLPQLSKNINRVIYEMAFYTLRKKHPNNKWRKHLAEIRHLKPR